MWVAYDVLGDWDAVLQSIVFDIKDLVEALRGERKKIIIWDDAGIHGSKYIWFTDQEYVLLLAQLFDLIRTRTASMIITTPSIKNLLHFLRWQVDWHVIKIVKATGRNLPLRRLARVYKQSITPEGRRLVRHIYDEYFTLNRIPEHVLDAYYKERDYWAKIAVAKLKAYIEKAKNKEKKELKNLEAIISTRGDD